MRGPLRGLVVAFSESPSIMIFSYKALAIEAREYGTIDLQVHLNISNWRKFRMVQKNKSDNRLNVFF